MLQRERQLARLLRALIACCALLFAFAPPSFAAETSRDTSGWVAERIAVAAVTRAPAARAPARQSQPLRAPTLLQPILRQRALPAGTASAAPARRRTTFDARRLYLDLCTLLC
jgi:hypothetical protein